jgi:hypothetical protein
VSNNIVGACNSVADLVRSAEASERVADATTAECGRLALRLAELGLQERDREEELMVLHATVTEKVRMREQRSA